MTNISNVSATVDPASVSSAASKTAGATSTSADKDMFLKLMVAQLKYQDPMNPADGTQFLAQTAQFTTVEKLESLATSMSDMLASNRQASAGSMIGRYVQGADQAGNEIKGTVTGIKTNGGSPILVVGNMEVPLTAVKEVYQTKPST
jgi:flagellar basal-body rod modification protein FlgD